MPALDAIRRANLASLLLAVTLFAAGCGGAGDAAPLVRVPAERRQMVDPSAVGGRISIPADRPFNIHVRQSSQNPGSEGTAEGRSEASESGVASASAIAGNGGQASAEFQIGQAIDWNGEQPVTATVKISFRLEHELACTKSGGAADVAGPAPDANFRLLAYVRDDAGRIHPTMDVATLSADDAPGRGNRTDVREFEFVMQPRARYQIALHGTAAAAAARAGTAQAVLKVGDLKMEIAFSEPPPAATAPAKTD